ncbi:MAG: hypothetical protein Ta2F_04300 [Termitinemataceae bacterium]|nr:MAG: hypothetical protein Ta2F_04300 [Termitinemataceae bacterium]
MKNKHLYVLAVCVFTFYIASCSTSGMHFKSSASWSKTENEEQVSKIKLGSINADKSGGSLSIEKEISQVLPLLFLEKGFVFTNNAEEASYIVDVCATEREFFVGWNTKKSVTMEVSFWSNDHLQDKYSVNDPSVIETPLAAGRIIAGGSEGLSSSNNLHNILKRSIAIVVEKVNEK